MKKLFFLFIILLVIISCAKHNNEMIFNNNSYENVKFIVVSDIHLYNKDLGYNTKEFNEYLNNDRKLLVESEEILEEFVNSSDSINCDLIIVPGDMTKDGEMINHKLVIKYLNMIKEKKDIPILVIPGNHDINNPDAMKFTNKGTVPIHSVTKNEFENIYYNFGYKDAFYRDKNSLSYIYEYKNTWFFALDACRYKENYKTHTPIIGGKFNKETLKWIEKKLIEANQKHKSIIVFMHHGILEHYKDQKKYFPDYVLDNYKKVSRLFAKYNAKFVFTGHFHANDITKKEYKINNTLKPIYDIETGSLITFPCAYKVIEIKNNEMHVSNRYIEKTKTQGYAFREYAKNFLDQGLMNVIENTLMSYKVKKEDAEKISYSIAQAIIMHYEGNEKYNKQLFKFDNIGLISKIIVHIQKPKIENMTIDLFPPDTGTLK